MIQATIVRQRIGDPAKRENPFNIYTDINLSTDSDIPELGFKVGDVILSPDTILVSDLSILYQQINNFVAACESRIANMLTIKANPITQPVIVDPSLYQPEPAPSLTDDEVAALQAAQAYQQQRQTLIQAKQDLDIGLIQQADFNAIQSSAIEAKTAVAQISQKAQVKA